MFYVERFFELKEAKSQYPRYELIGRQRSGSRYEDSWSTAGVFAILVDMHLLVSADFLVCTGSSNVCRLAYELLSAKSLIHGNAAFQMQSVDRMYQCIHSQRRWWRAIADFRLDGIELGDLVSISSKMRDCFVQTTWMLYTTREEALPAYLFEEVVQSV
ncbi:hypothetical protein AAHC03_019329 [Spirometra sp. Aus1]